MAQITIQQLNFTYEGAVTPVFKNMSATLDTDWRLGLIGRNGRGKTTLLRLLAGELPDGGAVRRSMPVSLYPFALPKAVEALPALQVAKDCVAPFTVLEQEMQKAIEEGEAGLARYGELEEQYAALGGYTVESDLQREAGLLGVGELVLGRPFGTLSGGEREKLLLAALFLRKNHFLLIDEPTNHLDMQGRALLGQYLAAKKGFLLVSHDRTLLDAAIDHVLVLGRAGVELQQGNYSSWKQNRERQDAFEAARNETLRGEIRRMEAAAARTASWGQAVEATKHGTRNSGLRPDRGYIGARAASMQQATKNLQNRQQKALQETRALLQNVEESEPLKLQLLAAPAPRILYGQGLAACRAGRPLFEPVDFLLQRGEQFALCGANGTGKTTLLRLMEQGSGEFAGEFWRQAGLHISVVAQHTDHLAGPLRQLPQQNGLDSALFFAILRKLGLERAVFDQRMEECSQGQKKKILLAQSLARPAHLYLWDEPLNYLDVDAREQLEELLVAARPTMVLIEHDARFLQRVASDMVTLHRCE